jgi:hypothetical protein
MKRWKPYPHLLRKATLPEISHAIDLLPEQEDALSSDAGRKAYKKASYRTLWWHGWEYHEFVDALGERMQSDWLRLATLSIDKRVR